MKHNEKISRLNSLIAAMDQKHKNKGWHVELNIQSIKSLKILKNSYIFYVC